VAYCTNCGAEEHEGQRFCPQCGALSPQDDPVLVVGGDVEERVPLAGFWWRLLGWFLDSLILLIPVTVLTAVPHNYWLGKVLSVGLTLLYATLFIGLRGRTPGMAIVKVTCVERATGQAAGTRRALVRAAYVAVVASFVTIYHPYRYANPITQEQKNHNAVVLAVTVALELPLILSYLWAAWDRNHQTLYDKVAGTVVTREVTPQPSPQGKGTITFEAPR
jgi:uncharacterized RDD family membrane protein YckC